MKKILSFIVLLLMFFNISSTLIFKIYASGLDNKGSEVSIDTANFGNPSSSLSIDPGVQFRYESGVKNVSGESFSGIKFFTTFPSGILYAEAGTKTAFITLSGVTISPSLTLDQFNPTTIPNYINSTISIPNNGLFKVRRILLSFPINWSIYENTLSNYYESADGTLSSSIKSSTVYVNVKPHITDYSFSSSSIKTGGNDEKTLTLKVKDGNGCSNIDSAIVKADLSQITGYSTSESLSFVSCDDETKTATFEKKIISNDKKDTVYTFSESNFSATDEDGNQNDANDTRFPFGKKGNITLAVAEDTTPVVNITDAGSLVFGGPLKLTDVIKFSSNQLGFYKVSVGNEVSCSGGTLIDWQTYSSTGSEISYTLNSSGSLLVEGDNTIYTCFKNSIDNKIGSSFIVKKVDKSAPEINNISFSPANISQDESSNLSFQCGETGTYKIEYGTGTLDSGNIVGNTAKTYKLIGTSLALGTNDIKITCVDEATNSTTVTKQINVAKATPTMGSITYFADDDFVNNGLDGRDITFKWNTTQDIVDFEDFESYRAFLFPAISNPVSLVNTTNHIALIANKSQTGITLQQSVTKDSLGDDLVNGGSYKLCMGVLSKSNKLGTISCSQANTLKLDVITNSNITGAKIIASNQIEITTDTPIAAANDSNHIPNLMTFKVGTTTYTGSGVISVNNNKIVFGFTPALTAGNTGFSGINLTVLDAIWGGVSDGGYNNNLTDNSIPVTDGQNPIISSFSVLPIISYNGFYNGNLEFNYTLSEKLIIDNSTKIEFKYISGVSGTTKNYNLTLDDKITSGVKSLDVNLDNLGLVSGATYEVKIYGKDVAGNIGFTSNAVTIKYDKQAPTKVVLNAVGNSTTSNINLSWQTATDDNGNGSGIKNYNLQVFNNNNCSGNAVINSNISSTSTGITLSTIGDYSWKVNAIDNIGNIGEYSNCSSFKYDNTIANISSFTLENLTTNNSSFIKAGDSIKITGNIQNADSIETNLSGITGNSAHSVIGCVNIDGITCTNNSGVLVYNLVAGAGINGAKSVSMYIETVTGMSTDSKVINFTADSTNPVVGTFTTPIGGKTYGGNNISIALSQNISDENFLKTKLEYSLNGGANYNLIGDNLGAISPYTWSLSGITTGTNYKVKLTAIDKSGNQTILESPIFGIDTTGPVINTSNIGLQVNKNIYKAGEQATISWNTSSISGTLPGTPISFKYTTDGTNYIAISGNYANNGTFNWTIPDGINSNLVKIKLVVTDEFSNIKEQIMLNSFVIDTTNPTILFGNAVPAVSSYINNSFEIDGTVFDSYLNNVTFVLKNVTSNKYFNGTSWQDDTIDNLYCTDSGVLGSNNNCNTLSLKLLSNVGIENSSIYRLAYKAIDKAGNIKEITRDFIGDVLAPNLTVSNDNNAYFKDNLIISGTSSDNLSGVAAVKLTIKNQGLFWDGNSFVSSSSGVFLTTNTSNNYSNWAYTFIPSGSISDGQEFEINVYAYDNSYIASSKVVTFNAKYDKNGPNISSGVFVTPNGGEMIAGGNGSSLNITWDPLKITDSNSGIKQNGVTLSYFNGSSWTEIVTGIENNGSFIWNNIPSIDVTSKIKITVLDNVGNSSSYIGNSFIIDSTPPEILNVKTRGDGYGKIDGLLIEFSEIIQNPNFVNITQNFSVSDGISLLNTYNYYEENSKTILEVNFNNSYGTTSSTPTLYWNGGIIEDIAGKKIVSGSMLSIDNAGPRILESKIFDLDSNGKFDKIDVYFSEDLSNTNNNAFEINNILAGINISNISISGNIATISLAESTNYNTAVGNLSLNFISNINWKDNFGNMAGSKNNISIQDNAAPVLYKSEYFDIDGNNKIDKVIGYFSENISGFNIGDFAISGFTKKSGNSTLNTVEFELNENSGDYQTNISSNLVYIKGSIQDLSGNIAFSKSITISDKVNPIIVKREAFDKTGNGKLDLIKLDLSEDIGNDFTSFNFVVDGFNISSYDKSCGNANNICINLIERPVIDTEITPKTRISANSSVVDLNGNFLKLEDSLIESTIDKMGPVILSARYEEGSTTGEDIVTIVFSEKLDLTNVSKDNFVIYGAGSFGVNTQIIEKGEDFVKIKMGENSTKLVPSITKIAIASGSLVDILGNNSPTDINYSKAILTSSIIINEVMYSANDSFKNQYIELRNLSSNTVDLTGYKLKNVLSSGDLELSGTIDGNGYYLISKVGNSIFSGSVVSNMQASLLLGQYTQSYNPTLVDSNGVSIDYVRSSPWAAGSNTFIQSMERKDVPGDGTVATNWYTAGASIGFVNTTPKGTPGKANIYDAIAPEITSFFPGENSILPSGNFDIQITYKDNTGGLGVSGSSGNIKLFKFDGTQWLSDISSSYISKNYVDAHQSKYSVSNLTYGKYKLEFTISDVVGNKIVHTYEFFVDDFSFEISNNNINLNILDYFTDNMSSNEAIITIKTIGAGFDLNMNKKDFLSSGINQIADYNNSKGYGYDVDVGTGYSGILQPIGNGVLIKKVDSNLNQQGELNTYIYKIKFGVKINANQIAGIYNVDNLFKIGLEY